uniref:Uncharacterized protein n=1 Tax=Zymomonas mobilis subsp. mobilis (strain ATCC 31821 / ZM4 / CP4) TaxID=264203 RepID=A0A806CGC1_ZYMMO|nr:hypothetical protein ZZM4_0132 [Zymomonas mobilis subsp. mobilis ZM4 = ATCC 31821]
MTRHSGSLTLSLGVIRLFPISNLIANPLIPIYSEKSVSITEEPPHIER